MSASEVIAEINKLPEAEQDQVLQYLVRSRVARVEGKARPVNFATDSEAEAAGDFVLREHGELLRRLAQ